MTSNAREHGVGRYGGQSITRARVYLSDSNKFIVKPVCRGITTTYWRKMIDRLIVLAVLTTRLFTLSKFYNSVNVYPYTLLKGHNRSCGIIVIRKNVWWWNSSNQVLLSLNPLNDGEHKEWYRINCTGELYIGMESLQCLDTL